jgi:hypothetical protein
MNEKFDRSFPAVKKAPQDAGELAFDMDFPKDMVRLSALVRELQASEVAFTIHRQGESSGLVWVQIRSR